MKVGVSNETKSDESNVTGIMEDTRGKNRFFTTASSKSGVVAYHTGWQKKDRGDSISWVCYCCFVLRSSDKEIKTHREKSGLNDHVVILFK